MCYRCKWQQRTFHKKLVRCIKICSVVEWMIRFVMLCSQYFVGWFLPCLNILDCHKVAITGKIRGKVIFQHCLGVSNPMN